MPLNLKNWWQVINPAIYLISILPSLGVILLTENITIHPTELIIATVAVVLLQHAINLFNDASDWKLGADENKHNSWVRFHHGNVAIVQTHAVVSFLLGSILGLLTLIVANKLWIITIASPLIIVGYLYNAGKKPLSYTWLGEWVTGICYGGVFFCLWQLQGLGQNANLILGTIAFAALAISLLLSHQPPQLASDKKAGKQSFAVRYGEKKTLVVSLCLCLFAVLLLGIGRIETLFVSSSSWMYLSALLIGLWLLLKAKLAPATVLLGSTLAMFFLNQF